MAHLLGVDSPEYDWPRSTFLSLAGDLRLKGMAAMRVDQPSSTGLPIADAANGDEVAFARIVAAYHADMLRVCQVITRDVEATNDAVQEAWSIAWRRLKTLREHDRLRQWLVAIAANEARQIVRRRRRVTVTELRADAPTFDDEGTRLWGGRVDLRNALAHLSPADRELLALRYVAGFDSQELSRITGLSASGTRARLQRLLATLRRELESVDD